MRYLPRWMELRFSHKYDPATVRMQFSNLRQMLDESLEDWGERVMTLAYQAFSGLDAAFVEHEMVNRFWAGLYDKDAAQFVMNSTPTSMEDALRRVRRYQENAISIYRMQGKFALLLENNHSRITYREIIVLTLQRQAKQCNRIRKWNPIQTIHPKRTH